MHWQGLSAVLFVIFDYNGIKASTLTKPDQVCAVVGGTAVFSWDLTLEGGETLTRINWEQKTPVARDILEVDGSYVVTFQPVTRASTNGSAYLILTGVVNSDFGTYECTVRTSDPLNSRQEATLLEFEPPANLTENDVELKATENTTTSVTLQWKDTPYNGISCEVLTYEVEYNLDSPSASWVSAANVTGSTAGNATLSFTVTGLQDGTSYKFGVRARNSLGVSNRVEITAATLPGHPTTAPPPTNPVTNPPSSNNRILQWVAIVFECQALWAAILMIAILSLVVDDVCCWTFCVCTDDCCCCLTCTCGAVNLLACIGPLVGVVIAVVVIILAIIPPNSGTVNQLGFTLVVVSSGAAAGMSICAAIDGFLFKYFGNGVKFPVATMSLEFSLGLMVAIAGTVMSAVYELGIAGIVIGATCIVLLGAAFIWFMCRVWCGKKQSSKVSQDFSETRSHNQIELDHHQAEGQTVPPTVRHGPTNERKGS